MPERETVWIDLTQPDLIANYEKRVRASIRKGVNAGLEVKWLSGGAAFAVFPDFYRNAMKDIVQDDFYLFSDDYFLNLFKMEQVRLAVARLNSELIGAAIFLFGPKMIEYHLSASSRAGRSLNATSFLLHEAGIMGQNSERNILYLGGGTDLKLDNPLFFFKSGFSANRSQFQIGRCIFDETAYSSLKKQFATAYQQHPKRVLFYR
jgi:lipid II:glycine glycyltransferase (peptidoglycan interpeptide bridge formation enzyme)